MTLIFTHCGRGIVAASRQIEARIADLGRLRGIETRVAYDGLRVIVR
ncbi:MAG TPA: hypothetical protein VIK60_18205 [Vicinamibacterales bacterium]